MEIPLLTQFLNTTPYLISTIAWIVALVFAVRMFRRSRELPERFLVIGASLMLANGVLGIIFAVLSPWTMAWLSATERGLSFTEAAMIISAFGLFRSCISLAGIVLLVIAFWRKFNAKTQQQEPAETLDF